MKRGREDIRALDDEDEEDEDSKSLIVKRARTRRGGECCLLDIPVHIIASIAAFLTMYEVFIMGTTCSTLHDIVSSSLCWFNRTFHINDAQAHNLGHCRFVEMISKLKIRNLGICTGTGGDCASTSKRTHNLKSVTQKSNCRITEFTCATFSCALQSIGKCLNSIVLRSQIVVPEQLFQILNFCPNLKIFRYTYVQQSDLSIKDSRSYSCGLNHNIPVNCNELTEVSIGLESQACCGVKMQLAYLTQIILMTQSKLSKLELRGGGIFVDGSILGNVKNVAYGSLRELGLRGQAVTDDVMISILDRTTKLENLYLADICSVSAKFLTHLPNSLRMLMLFHCKFIGAYGAQVFIPSLSNLNKLAFKSRLEAQEVCLQKGEYILLRKLLAACDPSSLNEFILNNEGKYCLNGLFFCSDAIQRNVANLKQICLCNTGMQSFALANLVKMIHRTDVRLGIASDHLNDLPALTLTTFQALTRTCCDLVIRAHNIPVEWLDVLADSQCSTRKLDLVNCSADRMDTTVTKCNVEKVSIRGPRCGITLQAFGELLYSFSNVKVLNFTDLNPFHRWTIQILSHSCPQLESLSIQNCSFPMLAGQGEFDEGRRPMKTFNRLKKFEMISCTNPCLRQLCLILYALPCVEDFKVKFPCGSNLELLYTPQGVRHMILVHHCKNGFFAELHDKVRVAVVENMLQCISLTKFWEWLIFTKVFREMFNDILQEDKQRDIPLIDMDHFCKCHWDNICFALSEECTYLIANDQSQQTRLSLLDKCIQQKIFASCMKEAASGCCRKGLLLTLPIIYHQVFTPIIKRVMESM